ncbi:MAG: DUF5606 domain-containing protein [Bacteroidetes bacterium]|nr:DUF5606 domain-containing protein [Bacteroidota bacterium]
MSLKGIISIAGFPGLYKVLAQSKSGFIVESLSDKKDFLYPQHSASVCLRISAYLPCRMIFH